MAKIPAAGASAALYTHDAFTTAFAKTAHGLVRGPSRFAIVGLIDRAVAPRDAGEALDGTPRGIPSFADLDALLAAVKPRPEFVVVGVATSGGVMPTAMRDTLRRAVEHGIGVVSGLHEFVSNDPVLVTAAQRSGALLYDVRKPKPRAELHFWSGAVYGVRAPRIAVLGTDCAVGKRTTCHALAAACREGGLRPGIVHTGQTGWLQGIPHGFVLDSTPNDFVSGELEHAVVECDRDLAPEVIFLEGQSALLNPSGPCGAELLLSAAAHGVVLQHAPARHCYEDQVRLGNAIAPLAHQMALIEMYGARVLGIALNDQGIDLAQREPTRARIESETGVATVWPLSSCGRLLEPIRGYLAQQGQQRAP